MCVLPILYPSVAPLMKTWLYRARLGHWLPSDTASLDSVSLSRATLPFPTPWTAITMFVPSVSAMTAVANYSPDHRQCPRRRHIHTQCLLGRRALCSDAMDQRHGAAKCPHSCFCAVFCHFADSRHFVNLGQEVQSGVGKGVHELCSETANTP